MKGKNGGCIGAIATLTIGMIALGFIITMFVVILGVAILGGFIYLMYWLYKTGKFDNITSKTNELISKIYTKLFKKELEKNIFTPKSFACVVTVLVLGGFWLSVQDSTPPADIPTAKVEDTVKVESTEKESETQHDTSNSNIDNKPKEEVNNEEVNNEEVSEENTSNIVSYGHAELHFISTGNSDAILIKQGDKYALIDGGDNDDEGTVVSYLKLQGVKELEYLIATHPHADHIGGLDAVVENFTIKKALVSNGSATSKTYEDFINAMANKGVYPSVPLLGSTFDLGNSTFKVLSVANTDDPNNNSIVLLWQNGNDKVLLMGDAEEEIEAKLLDIGKVDLLKVGHHGSNTSSSSQFINAINPEYSIIQVGANNKYGHPHKETMDTLKESGTKIHRTDECSDIVVESTGNGLTVDCREGSTNSPNSSSDSVSSTIKEESTEGDSSHSNSNEGVTVYWSTNGKKYHKNPNCSRMKNPSSGTIEQSGREACSKCA